MQLNDKTQGLSLYLSAGLSFSPERFHSDPDSALSLMLEGLSLMHLFLFERVHTHALKFIVFTVLYDSVQNIIFMHLI